MTAYHASVRTLVLWDIDHTLIASGPAGPAVYPRAFTALTGARPRRLVPTDGRTESAIMRDLLRSNGVRGVSNAEAARAMCEALAAHEPELRDHARALPGARDCLLALRDRPEVVQSVLTGNLRPNAELKLGVLDLDALVDFDVGAYGSDDAVRSLLVPVAQARTRQRHGFAAGAESTVLIGDTVHDVAAGTANGVRVLGVVTGPASMAELTAAGAT